MNWDREDSFENIIISEPLCTVREQMVFATNLPRKTSGEAEANRMSKEEKEVKQIRQFMVHYSVEH